METRVAFGYGPPPVGLGAVERPFVEDDGRAFDERPEGDVAVPRDPPDVGRAPVHVLSRRSKAHFMVACRSTATRLCHERCPWASLSCPRYRGRRAGARSHGLGSTAAPIGSPPSNLPGTSLVRVASGTSTPSLFTTITCLTEGDCASAASAMSLRRTCRPLL